MGESTNPRATLRFDRQYGWSFAALPSPPAACRELDDALGLTQTANECLQDGRLVGLLRQSVYSRLPATRIPTTLNGGPDDDAGSRWTARHRQPAASTNTMSRFETEVLTQDGNVEGLGRVSAWVDGAMSRTPHRRVILDMDSSHPESGTWRTGGSVVQRSLWEHVLSPRVQPVR